MALTAAQRDIFDGLVRKWAHDQEQAGNKTPLHTLAFATNAQVKTQTLAYVTAEKALVQAQQAGATAERAAQDAAWTAKVADLDAIITELG